MVYRIITHSLVGIEGILLALRIGRGVEGASQLPSGVSRIPNPKCFGAWHPKRALQQAPSCTPKEHIALEGHVWATGPSSSGPPHGVCTPDIHHRSDQIMRRTCQCALLTLNPSFPPC